MEKEVDAVMQAERLAGVEGKEIPVCLSDNFAGGPRHDRSVPLPPRNARTQP